VVAANPPHPVAANLRLVLPVALAEAVATFKAVDEARPPHLLPDK
jgi:hypothetical protein